MRREEEGREKRRRGGPLSTLSRAQLSHALYPAPPPSPRQETAAWAFLLQGWVLGGAVHRVGGPVGKQKVWALPHQRLTLEHPGETDNPLKVFQLFQWNREVSFRVFMRGHGTPLQYSCLENPMDGGAW